VALAESILDVAWKQIAQSGLDGINLRAIGRALGITAPAIYHYYPDRTALLQALRQRHLQSGMQQLQQVWQKHGTRRAYVGLHALWHEYRRWATAQPHAYMVVFMHDPQLPTLPVWAMQLLLPFVHATDALRQQNQMRIRTNLSLTATGQAQLTAWQSVVGQVDATAIATATVMWSRMHGLMSVEVGQHIPACGVEYAQLFRFELNAMMRELFYTPHISTTHAQEELL
jgi:AcrR family transcriptional regulator